MTPFDIVIVVGAICGLFMVVGGMVLLAIGAVKLKATATSAAPQAEQAAPEALTVEFNKVVKMTTRDPALGLFVIGVVFICLSALISKPSGLEPWEISGKIDGPEAYTATVRVLVDLKTLYPTFDGNIADSIRPSLDRFTTLITAPGCQEENRPLKIEDLKNHKLSLNAILRKIADKPTGNAPAGVAANIEPTPQNVTLPPVTDAGKLEPRIQPTPSTGTF